MNKIFGIFLFFMFLINITNVSALSITVNVPEQYTDVNAGDYLYFQLDINYPENPERKDLRLEYEVLNQEGDVITNTKTLKAIETQASLLDSLQIPETTETGLYIINIKVKDYEDLSQEVSSSFHIVSRKENQLVLYSIVLFGAIISIGIITAVNLRAIKRRKKK